MCNMPPKVSEVYVTNQWNTTFLLETTDLLSSRSYNFNKSIDLILPHDLLLCKVTKIELACLWAVCIIHPSQLKLFIVQRYNMSEE